MNTDCAFITGRRHRICQDYAISGTDYVIISDGCSSAIDSDWGSRILAKSAANIMDDPQQMQDDIFDIYKAIINAKSTVKHLKLNQFCMDATLIIAEHHVEGSFDGVWARAWGDGVIAAKKKNGLIDVWEIQYPSGHPTYPSYFVEKDREKNLEETFGKNWPDIYSWEIGAEIVKKNTVEANAYPFDLKFHKDEYEMVAIFSDGVGSFLSNGNPIQTIDVVKELMDIVGKKGEFIQRQINWIVKETHKRNWKIDDDLSMAGIFL